MWNALKVTFNIQSVAEEKMKIEPSEQGTGKKTYDK